MTAVGPLLSRTAEPFIARAEGSADWLVAPECHRLNQLCLRPLQRAFSCAIPSDEALSAIAALRRPFVEIGCGTGWVFARGRLYWRLCQRLRGAKLPRGWRVPSFGIKLAPGNGRARVTGCIDYLFFFSHVFPLFDGLTGLTPR